MFYLANVEKTFLLYLISIPFERTKQPTKEKKCNHLKAIVIIKGNTSILNFQYEIF